MDNTSISIIRGNFAKGSLNQFISSEGRGRSQVNITSNAIYTKVDTRKYILKLIETRRGIPVDDRPSND